MALSMWFLREGIECSHHHKNIGKRSRNTKFHWSMSFHKPFPYPAKLLSISVFWMLESCGNLPIPHVRTPIFPPPLAKLRWCVHVPPALANIGVYDSQTWGKRPIRGCGKPSHLVMCSHLWNLLSRVCLSYGLSYSFSSVLTQVLGTYFAPIVSIDAPSPPTEFWLPVALSSLFLSPSPPPQPQLFRRSITAADF